MYRKYFFLLLLVSNVIFSTASIAESAVEIIHLLSRIKIIDYKNTVNQYEKTNQIKDVNKKFQVIWSKIKELETNIYDVDTTIFIDYLSMTNYTSIYKEMSDYFDRVEFLFDTCKRWSQKYMKQNQPLPVVEFINDITTADKIFYPLSIIHRMYQIFFPRKSNITSNFMKYLDNYHGSQRKNEDDITFLDSYHETLESQKDKICDLQASPQHQLFSFYCEIIYAHIQILATLIFSYMWKSHYTDIKFNHLSRIQTYDTLQKIAKYTKLFENKIKKTSNIIRRCDSTKVKNETYAAIDGLHYAFVINQRHFENFEKYECRYSCNQLPDELIMYGVFNSTGYIDKCPGVVYDCQAGSSYNICPRNKNDQSSTKNYHWIIDNKSGLTYGNTSHECNTTVTEDSYTINRIMQWDTYTCESCICRCVDNRINTDSKTIRAFSYLWSNTSADMVATGARLVVQDRMIHIQLREAKLLPYGNVDQDSERWVPLPQFEYDNYFPSIAILADGTRFPLKRNRHYGKLEQQYGDKICLRKLIFDEKHLLTGVRFNATYFNNNNKDEERCFNIDTNYAEFNYDTGKIISKKSYNKQQPSTTELKLNQPDDPLKFETNVQDSENNQFIKIRVTDLVKDASQTTIPFFDIQEIITDPSVPLAGVELFHKGQLDKTSGGYVTLKLHPIDLSVQMTV